MRARSVVPVVGMVVMQAWLTCGMGFAASLTASIAVSVTVEAGCQVSPAGYAAEIAASGRKMWDAPVSVNCSLPTPYLVTVHNSSQADPAGLGSSLSGLGRLSGFGHSGIRDLDELRKNDPDYGPVLRVSSSLPAGLAESSDSGTVTVTVTY